MVGRVAMDLASQSPIIYSSNAKINEMRDTKWQKAK